MNFAAPLRRELSERALHYAQQRSLPHSQSYGEAPAICFPTVHDDHGNFFPASYRAILADPAWKRRLKKVHTQGRRNLPASDHGRWRELDSCNSSDALLMNIFCHPSAIRNGAASLLGCDPSARPSFGYRARVPLITGLSDRTEIDMRLGDLLVEAKLTESDFQTATHKAMQSYRDFPEVFEQGRLPQTEKKFLSYQLLRNVLAAHALECSFCVLLDARRPDLLEAWYAVMRAVRPVVLRTRLRVLTWQELASVLPTTLQAFLDVKYGIDPAR